MLDELKKIDEKKLQRLMDLAECKRVRCDGGESEKLDQKDIELIHFIRSNEKLIQNNFVKSLDTIIGSDDRRELSDTPTALKKSAKKAAALINKSFFSENRIFDVEKPEPYTEKAEEQALCEKCERFYGQPMAVGSTGVAIDDHHVLITFHSLFVIDWSKQYIVYGYWHENELNLDNIEVFEIEKAISFDTKADIALLKTKTAIPKGYQAKLSHNSLSTHDKIYSAGYPGPDRASPPYLGIPLKVVETGIISRVAPDGSYYYGHLDVNKRCSGSPVFDAQTHELAGLVAGTSLEHYIEHPICGKFVSCYHDSTVSGIEIISNQIINQSLKQIQL